MIITDETITGRAGLYIWLTGITVYYIDPTACNGEGEHVDQFYLMKDESGNWNSTASTEKLKDGTAGLDEYNKIL